MAVPFAFANLSGNIALSKLDSNFNTPITIGNTSVQLGGTITTLNNMTLSNVIISGGTNNVTETLANVTTLNATSAFITTGNISTANVGNLTLLNALTVPNGGTGMVTLPVNSVLLGNGTSPVASVAPGTAGNVLTSIGGVWTSNAAVGGGGVSSVTASSPVSSSGGTTPNISFISPGTAGNVLTSIGGVWVSNAAVGGGGGGNGVTSISFGSTGLTPSTATTGVVSVAGTLSVVNGGTGANSSTGSGSVVLSTSPTLVTPILGTPTSGNLVNCTFPTLNQNTTGNAAGLSATLVVGRGGTGLTSPGTTGNVLTSDGTVWTSSAPSVPSSGGVGTLIFAFYPLAGGPVLFGSTVSGGSLVYSNAFGTNSFTSPSSGTWKCLGYAVNPTTDNAEATTLWIRTI
jgi:hypothetical protein